ncbi:S-adenosyl-L-methionine-dependent methyltransferase [Pilobolus umbonatus]|nr:S-adenosyl-L-methionine-dependent methyltransferase [Pilobolus umbonatus]
MTISNKHDVRCVISSTENNKRARKYILEHYRHIIKSKEKLHQAFSRGEICVNGQPVEETRMLHEVHQDDYLAIVVKPSGQNFVIFEKALRHHLLPNKGSSTQNIWCINEIMKAASGLILVAKTEEVRDKLLKLYKEDEIYMIMRVIVKGHVSTHDMNQLFHAHKTRAVDHTANIIPTDILKSLDIISVTRSNHAQFISTLDLHLHTPISNSQLRQLFCFYSNHPIIGNSTYTKPLLINKDKGLYTALTSMTFMHPVLDTRVDVKMDEPTKFKGLREREAKFYERKIDKENNEIEKAGGLPIDIDDRDQGEPLAYLLGQKDFYGFTFKVTQDCLIPRTSSETLVKAALEIIGSHQGMNIIDVGTGCGNLLISILAHAPPSTMGVGIDISESALSVAKFNESTLLRCGKIDWKMQDMAHLGDGILYDIMVCNPPYLDMERTKKRKEQMAVLGKEPSVALFAKENGYEWYSVLHKVVPDVVTDNGYVILECGKGMMDNVLNIWSDWEKVAIYKDSQEWDRCVTLKRRRNTRTNV